MDDRVHGSLEMDLRNLQTLQSTLESGRMIALSKLVKRARRILVIRHRSGRIAEQASFLA